MVTKGKAKSAVKKIKLDKIATLPKQIKPIPKRQTKTEILKVIADATGLSTKVVKDVFATTDALVRSHLIKKGSGEFTIPEMGIKVTRKTKPATKERPGRNPVTGESITIPAKPKREVIRIKPMKALKDLLTKN